MTYSILVVDDDYTIKSLVEKHLLFSGFNAKSVSNANEAIDILKSFQADIVLTDISMEGMDGLELTRRIKKDHGNHIDIMVMTGYCEEHSYEEAIHAGASDFIFKPFRIGELDLRIKRVLREAESRREQIQIFQKMETLAITDSLTGLYNSRHFFSQVSTEIMRNNRYSHSLSLLMLDLDHFKAYNDTWGHLEGDKVLNSTGLAINSCMRSMDSAYRYGGEEFTILLPETKLSKACIVGERIKNAINAQVFKPGKNTKKSITVSIGAAELVEGEICKSFIHRADMALYQSKANGRNRLTPAPSEVEACH